MLVNVQIHPWLILTQWLSVGSPMLVDPYPSQQHAGLQHAVFHLQLEVTRRKARFKPTLTEKSFGGWMRNQVATYLGQDAGCTLLQMFKFEKVNAYDRNYEG